MSVDYNNLLVDVIENHVKRNWNNTDELKRIKAALESRKTKRSIECLEKVKKRIEELFNTTGYNTEDEDNSEEKLSKLIEENEKLKKNYHELEMKFNNLQIKYNEILHKRIKQKSNN